MIRVTVYEHHIEVIRTKRERRRVYEQVTKASYQRLRDLLMEKENFVFYPTNYIAGFEAYSA